MPGARMAFPTAAVLAWLTACTSPAASPSIGASPSPIVSSSPSGVPSPSGPGIYSSKLHGYTLTLPDGWLAGQQALVPWDGVSPIGHADLDVDQFVGPNGTNAWAFAAPTTETLQGYVIAGEAAAARDHPCPATPATIDAITIDGEDAQLTGMYCPETGGLLVRNAYTIHDGTGFIFGFQDPSDDPSAEPADRATFNAFINAIQFK
jgi:hypothetical protein